MTCVNIRQALSAMTDGELDQEQTLIIDRHIEGCPQCSSWFEKIKQADCLYAKIKAPSQLEGRIIENIFDEKQIKLGDLIRGYWINNMAPVMVICVVGVLVLFVAWSVVQTQGTGSSQLSGLHSYSDDSGDGNGNNKGAAQTPPISTGKLKSINNAPDGKQKIMRTATLRVDVKKGSAKKKLDSLIELVELSGGYVVDSNLISGKQVIKANATVRVPEKVFSKTINSFSALGSLKNLKQSGKDVSDEYVDLQARLRQTKAAETAYLRLYERASAITALLSIREKLSEVQTEAEQLQAYIAKLDEQVAFATLKISFQEDKPAAITGISAIWEKQKPIERGLARFIALVGFIVMVSITLSPLAVLAIAVAMIWRFLKAIIIKR